MPDRLGGFVYLIVLRIPQAMAQGQFQNPAGKGEIRDTTKYYDAAGHLRLGYHAMANAGS